MDPNEEEFHEEAARRLQYVNNIMAYIACEWDNVPETFLPTHAIFLNNCYGSGVLIPNAAGMFAETFLSKAKK
jgi:hypothetical protein